MATVHADSARCFIYSYKEGVLSRLAHDLKLEVRKLTLSLGEDGLPKVLRLDARSIELVSQMRDGVEQTTTFGESDRARILANLRDDVLHVQRFPEVVLAFASVKPEGDGHRLEGTLSLHGRDRPISIRSRREGDREVAEVTLHQPDFGITPFSAMLGALKVRADVKVRFDVRVT